MYRASAVGRLLSVTLVVAVTGIGLGLLSGCPGTTPGATEGKISGTVTNSATDEALADATVTLDPAVEGVEIMTGADGTYEQTVPAGVYTATIAKTNFAPVERVISVNGGQTATVDAALSPTAAVVVNATVEGTPAPGATVTAKATVEVLDGATTVTGYSWSQSNSVEVTISGGNTANATVTLPNTAAYKDELITVLGEPPISEAQLPENVPLPPGEFPGGFPNSFHIMGVNPFALEEAGLVTLTVEVTTSAGTFEKEVEVHATLPWKWAQSLHNVPVGVPVLLAGKIQDTYNWALTGPASSTATLTDATTRFPYFTPDASGKYTLTVTDRTGDAPEQVTMEIYAGTWEGAITGEDPTGRPLATTCTSCHNGNIAPDVFTPWAQTGHAEIFTTQIEQSDHYSESCLMCHTVGYDKDADNGGVDDAPDYDAFVDSGLFHEISDTAWETVLADFPDTAQLTNVQCENCHGPNNGGAHTMGAPRVSLSANVCGSCHGEPARHGRFQQWQLSGHANYELAMEEGGNGNCARCHSANGFLAWLPILLDNDPATDPLANVAVTWAANEIEPQSCVTCHDPHNIGTVSGDGTNAPVRITDDTPPLIAGYTAVGVGKGAICFTCHNSRRGLHNDETFAENLAAGDATRAPHGSAQGDVIMGENAYLVETGVRGPHSFVSDTCVNCHMRKTPPPDLLSYQQGGTNHTFYASADICAECHGELLTADSIQTAYDATAGTLKSLVESAIIDLIAAQIDAGNTVSLGGEFTVTAANQIESVEFTESHGQQAINVNLSNNTTLGPIALGDVDVLDATDTVLGGIYDFADARLVKAGWNYTLATNDGSRSVHNPDFVFGMLDAAIDNLTTLANE
ncbi:MAG TPA: hypothetical protein P5572_05035 [Phycisphaerae bacterium]|nr:hypothetical protein [Phycisphaerae bacterium]